MSLTDIAQAILRARDADFATLARIGGLDPKRHFHGADLRQVDFGDDDLSGFDFCEADLSGANLLRARGLDPAMFVGVRFDDRTKAPPGLLGPSKPDWATSIGRDEYGVFVTIMVPALRGRPVTQRLRWIPPGTFMMGSPKDETGRYEDEDPRHGVTIGQGFWLFDTPCTQALWRAVMGRNPSQFKSSTRPVESVSFADVQTFLQRLNGRVPGLDLVLPSEAQWEYACRAGTTAATYGPLDAIAWHSGNSTQPVATKAANLWGLYDMLGNVWEWCADHYWHADYQGAPDDGSAWLDPGADEGAARRVVRGGSWRAGARRVRAACRDHVDPAYRVADLGFRCARVRV